MSETTVTCPICYGTTDTGGECNDCPFDWQNDERSEKQKYIDEWERLTKQGAKEDIAEFLRFNIYGDKINYSPYN